MKRFLITLFALGAITMASAQFSANLGMTTNDYGVTFGVQYAMIYEEALVSFGLDIAPARPLVEVNAGVHAAVTDNLYFGARLFVPFYDSGHWLPFVDAGASVIYQFTPEISAEAGMRSIGVEKNIALFLKVSYDIF